LTRETRVRVAQIYRPADSEGVRSGRPDPAGARRRRNPTLSQALDGLFESDAQEAMSPRGYLARFTSRSWSGASARDARARRMSSLLANAEVVGDGVDACEPKYKQSDGERADERQRGQAEARDSLARGLCSSDPRRRGFTRSLPRRVFG
jgi:hypothetical protein